MSRSHLMYLCKRARQGLYAGRTILSGNNVSEDGGNRTRRRWLPNAQNKKLYSEILGKMVDLRVTTHALRCIDKAGGLDAYILNTREEKLYSEKGSLLKTEMLLTLATQRPAGEGEGSGAAGAPAASSSSQ